MSVSLWPKFFQWNNGCYIAIDCRRLRVEEAIHVWVGRTTELWSYNFRCRFPIISESLTEKAPCCCFYHKRHLARSNEPFGKECWPFIGQLRYQFRFIDFGRQTKSPDNQSQFPKKSLEGGSAIGSSVVNIGGDGCSDPRVQQLLDINSTNRQLFLRWNGRAAVLSFSPHLYTYSLCWGHLGCYCASWPYTLRTRFKLYSDCLFR